MPNDSTIFLFITHAREAKTIEQKIVQSIKFHLNALNPITIKRDPGVVSTIHYSYSAFTFRMEFRSCGCRDTSKNTSRQISDVRSNDTRLCDFVYRHLKSKKFDCTPVAHGVNDVAAAKADFIAYADARSKCPLPIAIVIYGAIQRCRCRSLAVRRRRSIENA